MTGEGSDVLALAMRVNFQTIEWYRKAFYDISPYLKHPEYVFTRLLGIVGEHGHNSLDEADLWRLVGYLGGVKALTQLLGHARGAIDVAGDEGVWGWLAQRIQTTLQTKQLLAISHLKPDDEQHRLGVGAAHPLRR